MIAIYKITSPSGKVYIGQSWDIETRWKWYHKLRCKGQIKLYNSLIKYTPQCHNFQVIHELPPDITQEILNKYEILYWDLYKEIGIDMLNIREPTSRGKQSEETKLKRSIALKGRSFTKEHRENISKGKKGKPLPPEHMAKLVLLHTGRKRSKETIQKMKDSYRNRKTINI